MKFKEGNIIRKGDTFGIVRWIKNECMNIKLGDELI